MTINRIISLLLFYRTGKAWLQRWGILETGQKTVLIPADPADPNDWGGVEVVKTPIPSDWELVCLSIASWLAWAFDFK